MGDPAGADLDTIPAQYAIQTDPAWAGDGVMIHTRSSTMLITENVLDLTHASYLHAWTVGTDYVPYMLPDTLIEDNHVAVSRTFKNVKNPSTFIKIMGFEMADREQVIHFWPPGYCLLDMNIRPTGVDEPIAARRMIERLLVGQ
jgi:vanillate O-demethylase monooxygenase subunit